MAKGNFLLGYARGKVGSLVFSRVKGQMVTKPRNTSPNNPKTLPQCYSRARFAAAVKFFSHGMQKLFKFAFENKTQFESDYNAFMRANVKMSPAISKAAFDNYDYPVIAPFVMSKGSLQPFNGEVSGDNVTFPLGVETPATLPSTVGELSALMIANERFQSGDILTLVTINSTYDGTVPSVDAIGIGASEWDLKQIIIDTTSTDSIASVLGATVVDADGILALQVAAAEDATFSACTLIHSRQLSTGLKVSTSTLYLTESAAAAYEASIADEMREAVAVSWQKGNSVDMQPEAILQGAIAYNQGQEVNTDVVINRRVFQYGGSTTLLAQAIIPTDAKLIVSKGFLSAQDLQAAIEAGTAGYTESAYSAQTYQGDSFNGYPLVGNESDPTALEGVLLPTAGEGTTTFTYANGQASNNLMFDIKGYVLDGVTYNFVTE